MADPAAAAAAAARPQPPAVQAPASATAARFTPLLGVDGRQPLSYLLELDGFTILLDCGWDDAYDPALLEPLLAVLPRVDAGAVRDWGAGACNRRRAGCVRCSLTACRRHVGQPSHRRLLLQCC